MKRKKSKRYDWFSIVMYLVWSIFWGCVIMAFIWASYSALMGFLESWGF